MEVKNITVCNIDINKYKEEIINLYNGKDIVKNDKNIFKDIMFILKNDLLISKEDLTEIKKVKDLSLMNDYYFTKKIDNINYHIFYNNKNFNNIYNVLKSINEEKINEINKESFSYIKLLINETKKEIVKYDSGYYDLEELFIDLLIHKTEIENNLKDRLLTYMVKHKQRFNNNEQLLIKTISNVLLNKKI